MKRRYLILFIIFTFVFELFVVIYNIKEKTEYSNDVIKINELVSSIKESYGDTSKYPKYFDYTVIDNSGNLIYKTKDELSQSLNEAYKNRDTIIDLIIDNEVKGKIIICNDVKGIVNRHNDIYINIIIWVSSIQLIALIIYYIVLYKKILEPFNKMKNFAIRVSNGNLDIPLEMDRKNNFGAFTEAFDIMRYEIKKARIAEKKTIEDKKELVAKLSHDIKTPIASIKSSSELGLAISNDEKTKECFKSINQKSDQINILVTNLFNSTLEELEELNINPIELKSNIIKELIDNADYLNRNNEYSVPECKIFGDRLRLQQVFDNVFANSYKYANTKIETKIFIENEYLVVSIRDFGSTINDEEVPLLTEKFKRGTNTGSIEGAGLGLYISKELLRKMNGNLEIKNENPGFNTTIYLRII